MGFNLNVIWENEEPSEEFLQEVIEEISTTKIKEFLDSKGLDLLEVNVDSEESFIILYDSRDFSGRIPPKISYYFDELEKLLAEELATPLAWGFGNNGNCNQAIFYLENPIDPKWFKARRALKIS